MWRVLLTMILLCPALLAGQPRTRNVILFLADAAGIPTLNAASLHGYGAPRKLFVQRMPQIGLSETSTASEFVTDSAAGMTAIVTGVRTHNGVIGQGADAVRGKKDGRSLKTILEYAEERGLSTGVITNDLPSGATPAALYAKVNDRAKSVDIFLQAFAPRFGDGVDVLIGAGRSDLEEDLAARHWSLARLEQLHGRRILRSVHDIESDATRAVVVHEDEDFDLTAAVETAIRMLSRNPNGYFLAVESDAHTDSIRKGLDRVVSVDRTIERVASIADGDTLLLFTADHSFDLRIYDGLLSKPLLEGAGAEMDSGALAVTLRNVRMNDDHTGEEVLVAAQGPGSDRVHGYLANTDLFHVMMGAFGWTAGPAPPLSPVRATAAVADDADDPAVWIDQADPSSSLILGTNKVAAPAGALYVFDLHGRIRQTVTGLDRPNNVDVEYGLPSRGGPIDIAVVTERLQHRLRVFQVTRDGVTAIDGGGVPILSGETGEARMPMGIALYRRPRDGAIFAIVAPKTGGTTRYLWQYRLRMDGPSKQVRATFVRRFGDFSGTGEIEAVAVDDELGYVYYADEEFGVHKWHADPDHRDAARQLAVFGRDGFVQQREGIAVVPTAKGAGYIVVSDQIERGSRLRFYPREGAPGAPHRHEAVTTLETAADSTDGIEMSSAKFGAGFESGLFIMMNSAGRNFQLYGWDDIRRRVTRP